ncbi:MAG: GLPGLI family protein [Chryseobacterium sp.]|nr:MAG: GLPGLI family protein [Chryseobacterium sp.]
MFAPLCIGFRKIVLFIYISRNINHIMHKLLVLFVSFFSLCNAQTNRFIYEYKFVPNVKEKDSVRTNLMALDITDKGSSYKSLRKMQRDSLIRERVLQSAAAGTALTLTSNFTGGTVVNHEVTKEYPDYKVFLIEQINSDIYKIADDKKINWQLSPETQKIGDYTAQKATTSFGGREWVAWFTTELPFPDGPYKFHGLPGLIVKSEDTTGSHIMTLVANKKIQTSTEMPNEVARGGARITFGRPAIPVTETQFRKAWKDYLADPAKEVRKNMGGSTNGNVTTVIVYEDAKGNRIDPAQRIRSIEENVKKRLETDNNKIEPDLFQ